MPSHPQKFKYHCSQSLCKYYENSELNGWKDIRKWKGAKIYLPQLLFPIADHDISLNIVQEGAWNSQERLRLKQKDSSQKAGRSKCRSPEIDR